MFVAHDRDVVDALASRNRQFTAVVKYRERGSRSQLLLRRLEGFLVSVSQLQTDDGRVRAHTGRNISYFILGGPIERARCATKQLGPAACGTRLHNEVFTGELVRNLGDSVIEFRVGDGIGADELGRIFIQKSLV